MPPLQINSLSYYPHGSSFSPSHHSSSGSEHYVYVEDNRIVFQRNRRGRVLNKDIFSCAPLPQNKSADGFPVLSQRDVVDANPILARIQHHINGHDDFPRTRGGQPMSMTFFMDMFTNLCLCPDQVSSVPSSMHTAVSPPPSVLDPGTEISRQKIVYPVARYPDRLNNPEMVQQRRKSLQKHLFFRPVGEQ